MPRLLLKNSFVVLNILSWWLLLFGKTFATPEVLDIQTTADSSGTTISLLLSENYEYIPRIEPGQGIVRMGLHNLSVAKPTSLTPVDQNISKISLTQNGAEALLAVQLRDILQSTVGMVQYQSGDNSIIFRVNSAPQNNPIAFSDTKSDSAPALVADYSILNKSSLKFIFYSVLMLVVLFIGLKGYQSILLRRKSLLNLGRDPKLLNVYHLSAKQKIWLLEINNQQYAVGVTPQSMQLICRVTDEHKDLLYDLSREDGASLAKVKAAVYRSLAKKKAVSQEKETPLDNLPNLSVFKAELKKRMKRLKPVK